MLASPSCPAAPIAPRCSVWASATSSASTISRRVCATSSCRPPAAVSFSRRGRRSELLRYDDEAGSALDGVAWLHVHLLNGARAFGDQLVLHLHCLDHDERPARLDLVSFLDEHLH